MIVSDRTENRAILTHLKKNSFSPLEAIRLILKLKEDFCAGIMTDDEKSSFLTQLQFWMEKLMKKKFISVEVSVVIQVFNFILEIINFVSCELDKFSLEKLEILTKIVDPALKFYKKNKNPHDQISEVKKSLELTESEDEGVLAFGTEDNLFFFTVIKEVWKRLKIFDLAPFVGKKVLVDYILNVFDLLKSVFNELRENFWNEKALNFLFSVSDVLKSLKGEDLRILQKDRLKVLIQEIENFTRNYLKTTNSDEIVEKIELELAYNLLECPFLDKKMAGAEELNRKARQVKRKDELKSISPHSYYQDKPTKFLTSEMFCDWIKEKRILELVYSGTFHVEVIKKFTDIVTYMYSMNKIGRECIDMIWENGFLRHKIYKEVHLDIIHDLMFNINSQDLKYILMKIQNLVPSEIDINVLKILKKFSCLTNRFESPIISSSKTDDRFTFLELLWNLCNEEVINQGATKEIHQKAIIYFSDCITSNAMREMRLFYSENCIKELSKSEKTSSFLEILKKIIDSFPSLPSGQIPTKQKFAETIQDKVLIALFEKIYTLKLKFVSEFPAPEAFLTYKLSLDPIFSFFKFFLKLNKEVLPFSSVEKMWKVLMINRIIDEESAIFFQFLKNIVSNNPVISEKQILENYSKILVKLDPETMTEAAFDCFEKYFLKVNQIYSYVTLDSSDFLLTVQKNDLISIEKLWKIVLFSSNPLVFENSSSLLKRLYRFRKSFSLKDQEEFISKCFENIVFFNKPHDKNSSQVLKSLQLVIDFLSLCQGLSQPVVSQSQQQSFEFELKVVSFVSRLQREEFSEMIYSTTHWQSIKELIASRVNRDLNKVNFLIDGKIVWGNNGLTAEQLNLDKFQLVEVREMENESSFDEHLNQLKCIFEHLDDDIIKLALQKEGNNFDEALNLLTSQDFVDALKSEMKDKNMQVVPFEPLQTSAPNKTKILNFVAQNDRFLEILYALADVDDENVLIKVLELLKIIPINKNLKNNIMSFELFENLFNSSNVIKFWNQLRVIILLLQKEKGAWMKEFFENGGLFNISSLLISSNSTDSITWRCYSDEILQILIEIIITYIKKFFTNSNFIFEDIIDPSHLSRTLLSLISSAVSSLKSEEMIESALSLLIAISSHNPSLLSNIYTEEVFKSLTTVVLLTSTRESLRSKIIETVRTLLTNLGNDCSQYFWNLMSGSIPKQKSPQTKDFFHLLSIILETVSEVSTDFIDSCVQVVMIRNIDETKEQDYLLAGYFDLLLHLLKNHNSKDELRLLIFLYSAVFELNTLEDFGKDVESLPLIKYSATRHSALRLLSLLLQKFPRESYETLKKLADHHPSSKLQQFYNYENQSKASCGFVGLRNFGCTCYLNSVLQQLFMIQDFQKALLEAHVDSKDNIEENLVYQVQVILANLKHSQKQCYEPSEFCKAFKDFEGLSINVRVQQDADEFLNLLFDKLEERLKLTDEAQVIRKVIGGEFKHEIRSTQNEFPYRGERDEHFFRISLDIRNLKDLKAAFDQYTAAEVLEGDNKYYCEEFNTKVNATKRCLLGRLQNTIIIHLKRFDFNYQEMKRSKINDRFEFPLNLNLKTWCMDDSLSEDYYDYELAGVIIHSGVADSGHYFSIIKDRKSQNWLKFDDRHVQLYDFSNLTRDCFGKDSVQTSEFDFECMSNAYMLIYERKQFQPVYLQESRSGFHLTREVEKQVIEENIQFLKDRIYFEEAYENFLIDLAATRANEEKEYHCEWIGFTFEKKVLDMAKTVGQILELVKSVDLQGSTDQKIIRGCFIYSLELLIKAEKNERFLKISEIVFNLVLKTLNNICWVLDLFRFNKVLFFTVMNSVNNEAKLKIMEFLMKCLKKAIFNQDFPVFEKICYLDGPFQQAGPLEPIVSYINSIYKSPVSRFLEYLMQTGVNSFTKLYNIEQLVLGTIVNISSSPEIGKFLMAHGTTTFLLNIFNSPSVQNLDHLHQVLFNMIAASNNDPNFLTCECSDHKIFKTTTFSEFVLKNINFYLPVLNEFLAKDQEMMKKVLETLLMSFGGFKTTISDNWKVLQNFKKLSMNSLKRQAALLIFENRFGGFNKVSFLEDVIFGSFSEILKTMIAIWWGDLMQDKDFFEVSKENSKKLSCLVNMRFTYQSRAAFDMIGVEDPEKRLQDALFLVKQLS